MFMQRTRWCKRLTVNLPHPLCPVHYYGADSDSRIVSRHAERVLDGFELMFVCHVMIK